MFCSKRLKGGNIFVYLRTVRNVSEAPSDFEAITNADKLGSRKRPGAKTWAGKPKSSEDPFSKELHV